MQKAIYKETELGEFPSDWNIKTLKEINSDKKKNMTPVNFPDEIFEYYSIPAYQDNQLPVLEQGKKILSQKVLLDKGTVLFGKLNPRVEKVWIVKSDSEQRKIGSTEWITVFPNENECDPDFLYYMEWSKYVMPLAKDMVSGSTPSRQRVKPTSFYQIKIPMPPVLEQKKIAHVLTTIQTSIQKSDRIINSYKELKKSMMKHLFIYGPVSLEEAEKIKLKETEIGMINGDWEVKRLRDFLLKTNQKDMRKVNIEFKYIDVSSISRELLTIISHTIHKGKKAPSRARKIIKNNDVIFATVRPTLKRIAKVTEEYDGEICSTAFCVLRADNINLNHDYLFYAIQRPSFIGELGDIERGANYPAVTDNNIRDKLIPLPDLEMQKDIGGSLNKIDQKIVKEINEKKSLEFLFKSMLHSLMSAKIRVKDIEVNYE